MSEPTTAQAVPGDLHNPDGFIIATRIDGPEDTRGKAKAFFASQWDLDFPDVKVRRSAYRPDHDRIAEAAEEGIPEPYDGWPWVECKDDEPGAHRFWTLGEEHWNG